MENSGLSISAPQKPAEKFEASAPIARSEPIAPTAVDEMIATVVDVVISVVPAIRIVIAADRATTVDRGTMHLKADVLSAPLKTVQHRISLPRIVLHRTSQGLRRHLKQRPLPRPKPKLAALHGADAALRKANPLLTSLMLGISEVF